MAVGETVVVTETVAVDVCVTPAFATSEGDTEGETEGETEPVVFTGAGAETATSLIVGEGVAVVFTGAIIALIVGEGVAVAFALGTTT